MATDGPDPTPCDREVYRTGTLVFKTNSIPSNAMEAWVKKVATESGQRINWHFAGGRAMVLALGDLAAVRDAIRNLLPEHDRLQMNARHDLKCSWQPDRWLLEEGESDGLHEMLRSAVIAEREGGA